MNNVKLPKVSLLGTNGNAFSILHKCHKSARKHGWDDIEWNAFQNAAMAGDYNNLIRLVAENFDIE